MADAPDFEHIARELATHFLAVEGLPDGWFERNEQRIAEQLRLIWNARGAADIAKVEHELATMMGGNAAGPYINNLARALRALDR